MLIANERRERLRLLSQMVARLGHEVVAREINVREVAALSARERTDVALVGLGSSFGHDLALISRLVPHAACPVIALLARSDSAYIREAAERGESPTSATTILRSFRPRKVIFGSGN